MKNFRKLAVVQARMNSIRLPGKVLKLINGMPVIYWQLMRILRSNYIDKLVVATSTNPLDDPLVDFLRSTEIEVFRGSEIDVFDRFSSVIREYSPEIILRLTADCPLVMPNLIDSMGTEFDRRKPEYMSNALFPTFPDGLDIEIFTTNAFYKLQDTELSIREREHVTLGLYSKPEVFDVYSFQGNINLSQERWTLDYLEDFEFIKRIYGYFAGRELEFDLFDVLEYLEEFPEARNKVSGEFRNITLKKRSREDVE